MQIGQNGFTLMFACRGHFVIMHTTNYLQVSVTRRAHDIQAFKAARNYTVTEVGGARAKDEIIIIIIIITLFTHGTMTLWVKDM